MSDYDPLPCANQDCGQRAVEFDSPFAPFCSRECQRAKAWRQMLAALELTSGNIRSLGPAGAIPPPYEVWLEVVDAAINSAGPDSMSG